MKIICMIPARLDSSRVKKKCLRYLGDKPLVQHVIDTCKKVKRFEEIYLNSPNLIFKEIADNSKIKFYHRREWKNPYPETNDEFMSDFLNNIECDYVIQVNPTSPFMTSETIEDFIDFIINNHVDTCITTTDVQIEGLFKGIPINFQVDLKLPRSQDLTPIEIYSSSMFGFKRSIFLEAFNKYGYSMNGPIGLTKYFKLNDLEAFDIDYEEDFQLAEALFESIKYKKEPRFYNSDEEIELHVPSIMKRDGVEDFKEGLSNFYNIEEVIEKHLRDESWSERLVNTDSNSATLIYQLPGEGNRFHYHPTWNEWWFILDGEGIFFYGKDIGNHTIDSEQRIIKKNDLVIMPKGLWHKVTATGNKPFIRLAVAREDMPHVYGKDKKNG